MSASREKNRRKSERESGVQNKNEKFELNPRVFRNLITALCVIVVLVVIAAALVGQGLPQQYMTAASVDGKPVSVAEFNYNYYNSLQSLYNNVYFSYLGIDTSKPLYKQEAGDGQTWHDYLVQQTLTSLKEIVHFSELAKQEGVVLSTEDTDTIDATMEAIKNGASIAGISEQRYVRNIFGRGVTVENLKAAMEREMLARRYQITMRDAITYTNDEVSAYYETNKNNYDKVTYRSFSATKALSDEEYDALEAEGQDLAAEVETPFGTMTAEDKLAYDIAASLSENAELNADNFNELARELAPEAAKESYDDPDYTLSKESAYYDGAVQNWLFDPARQPGDVTLIDNSTEFITVMFIERIVEDYNTVSYREIYIAPASQSGSYTDAEWEDTRTRAQVVLDRFANEGGTEDTFIKLVKEESMDASVKFSGGLQKEIGKDYAGGDEFDEWLFDPARKPGDNTLIKSDYGYHILYFKEVGRANNLVEAETTMRDESYNASRTEKLTAVPEPASDWFGIRFISRA